MSKAARLIGDSVHSIDFFAAITETNVFKAISCWFTLYIAHEFYVLLNVLENNFLLT